MPRQIFSCLKWKFSVPRDELFIYDWCQADDDFNWAGKNYFQKRQLVYCSLSLGVITKKAFLIKQNNANIFYSP